MAGRSFVARRAQLERLHTFLDQVLEGQGRVALVVGEAGSGKTALLTEFARRAQLVHDQLPVVMGNCNAQTGIGDPYLPFRELLAQLTGDVEARLSHGAITTENARRLGELAAWSCEALMEFGPDLIGVLVPGAPLLARVGKFVLEQAGWVDELKALVEKTPDAPRGAALEQGHIFEQYTSVLQEVASKRPLMLILDDLQWADNASTSLLFHLARRIGDSQILVLGAYRPEEVRLGRGGERHPLDKVLNEFRRYFGDVWVDLDQAEQDEAGVFIDCLLELEPNRLTEGFRQALVQHTGGHALFAVELVRDMQERGDLERDAEGRWVETPELDWGGLPPRVEGVIEERIGRLEDELHQILTVGSVEGETFTAEVVARVQEVDERGLVRRVSEELDRQHTLVMSQGVRRLDTGRLSFYRFRHNLFQQYLYDGLDAAQAAYLHEDVGRALEALYGDEATEIAAQLARHFREAGLTERAVRYLRLAGEKAVAMSANAEAIAHLTNGLALLQTLPPTPERDELELPLQMGLATARIVAEGWSSPGVRGALNRACELCRGVDAALRLFAALRGLYTHYHALGAHRDAYQLAEQLMYLAQESRDAPSLLMAHHALGQSQAELGQFVEAQATLEQGLAYHDPQTYRSLAYLYGEEHGVSSRIPLMVSLFAQGYPDRALARVQEALGLAEALAHPHVLAYALYAVSSGHVFRREPEPALALADRAIALCREQGIPFWMAVARINRGHALAMQGHAMEGIAEASDGLADYRMMGASVLRTVYLTLLAEMHGVAGQPDEGLRLVAEALGAVEETGERLMEAELYRLRVELQRMQGHDAQAEADLTQALEIARRQHARWWELRATTSLARLWRDQGRRDEARHVLADIYGTFTEGFDTPDLQEAGALLEELGG